MNNDTRKESDYLIAFRKGLDHHDLGTSPAELVKVRAFGEWEAERDFKAENPDTQFLAVWPEIGHKLKGNPFGLGDHLLIMLKEEQPQLLVNRWRATLPDGTLEEFVKLHINNDTFMVLPEHPGFLMRYQGW